jgi:tRNA (cytidine/uridine-2'-O-)-methyltransferase
MKIILYQPQIPQNAGNIVRTCAVSGCDLIMVRPLGFSTNDRWLKRAGLDYWEGVNVSFIDDLEGYLTQNSFPFYFFSSKATTFYSSVTYQSDTQLIFGSETTGLPQNLFEKWPDHFVKIPMIKGVRCLNLATSAGIGIYEAWRQQGFS